MSVPNVRMLTTYLSGVTRHTCYVHKFLYLHRVKSNTLSTSESETSSKRLHSVYVVSRPLPVVFFSVPVSGCNMYVYSKGHL